MLPRNLRPKMVVKMFSRKDLPRLVKRRWIALERQKRLQKKLSEIKDRLDALWQENQELANDFSEEMNVKFRKEKVDRFRKNTLKIRAVRHELEMLIKRFEKVSPRIQKQVQLIEQQLKEIHIESMLSPKK